MIKLYKVIYGIKYDQSNLVFIDDVIIKDTKLKKIKFKGPITCITQSSRDGKIIVNCWDGNVYLFKHPNINYYLQYDKEFFL